MLHEMHQVLKIPELQLLILEQLGKEHTCKERGRFCKSLLPQRKDILSFALTCKTFFPIAMAKLWRSAPSLLHLIQTFPKDLWTIVLVNEFGKEQEDTESDDSEWDEDYDYDLKIKDEQLTFTRALRDEDWYRFDMYASHIRELLVSRGSLFRTVELFAIPEIAPLVFAEMGKSRPAHAWIPNLEEIIFDGMHFDILLARHLFHQNLKSIIVGQIQFEETLIERGLDFHDARASAITTILESAALSASNLTSLEFFTGFMCGAHHGHLIGLLKSRSIKHLRIKNNLCENQVTIHEIAKSNLETLDINIGEHSLVAWKSIAAESGLLFPNLINFHPNSPKLEVLTGFMANLARPTFKSLIIDCWGTFEITTKHFRDFVNSLLLHCDVSKLEVFWLEGADIQDESETNAGDTTQAKSALLKLLSSSQVYDLSLITVPHALLKNIEVSFLNELAKALPNAERIVLRTCKHKAKSVNLQEVAKFSSKLPHLLELVMTGVDATRIPRSAKVSEEVRIQSLSLIHTEIGKVDSFIKYVKKNFPSLLDIDAGEVPTTDHKWRRARQGLMKKERLLPSERIKVQDSKESKKSKE